MGLSDLMLDSLDRGVVELRVRGEAGAKGKRARRVPVVPKLAAEITRYVARHRPEVAYPNLLINEDGRPYGLWGIDAVMNRLSERVSPSQRSPRSVGGTSSDCELPWAMRTT